ncbi:hypothetical protein NC652_001482 [Populus alba x Populus x berolinensis]|nr:hypothetical protein NC652_001482 [Populus alba x Populus x berolinensis]
MASIPDFFSDYQFSPDDFSEITSIMAEEDQSYVRTDSFSSTYMSSCAVLGDHQDHGNFPVLYDHRNDDALDIFLGESEIMSPIPVTNSLPQPSGILDMDVLPKLMDYKMGGHRADIAKIQDFDAGFRLPDACGYREYFGEVIPNFTPVCPLSGEKWEVEYDQTASTKSSETKSVVRYTAEERKERILRYLKKKNLRTYNNNVKYACRKTIAGGRPRVRGRFVKAGKVKTKDIILHKHQEKGTHCDGDAMRALLATIFEEE